MFFCRGQPTCSGPPAWGSGVRLTTWHCKSRIYSETSHISLGTRQNIWNDLGKEKWTWYLARGILGVYIGQEDRSCSQNGRRCSVFTILTCTSAGKIPLERPRVDGRTILDWTLKKYVSLRGIGLIRLRVGIIGGPLWMRHWTSGFHNPWC